MAAHPDASPDASEAPGLFARTFAALSERDYAWYFVGNTAFFMAMQMNFVVRGYLAFELTDSATALGLVAVSFAIPMMLVAPVAGVISDRVNKKHLLMVMQTCSGLVNLVIAILIVTGNIEFWHLLATAVVTGSIMSTVMPTRQAVIPQLVPQQLMMNAISLQMGGMNLTRILGPAVGGLAIAPLGVGGVYFLTVGLFVLSVLSLIPLPSHGMVSTTKEERSSFIEDLFGGFQFIAGSSLFRLLIASALLMPLFAFPVQQILPVLADDPYDTVFGESALALGVMMSATGVGGLVGAIISAALSDDPRKGMLMFAGAVSMVLCFVVFATASLWLPVNIAFAAAVLLLIAGNVGAMIFQVTNNSVIQARVPEQYRGRVMSVMMMSFGTMPLGVVPVTMAADAWGAPAAIIGSQAIGLVIILAIFGASRALRELRIASLGRAEMSPSQAARLVADGEITQAEADRLSGRSPRSADVPESVSGG